MTNLTSFPLVCISSNSPPFDLLCFSHFLSAQMTKISVEFCIISARGLGRKSSLLKPQWFSVAWVDPNSKYCTKIDASGNSDASWGTKFSLSVDEHDVSLQQMALTVEVYRREPIFLKEHLQGAAVVQMKEYFDKFAHDNEQTEVVEETASFQLRRKKSEKAHGLVDISVRICKEDDYGRFSGPHEGSKYSDQVGITLAIEDGPVYTYPPLPSRHFRGHSQDTDHYSNSMSGTSYSYQPQTVPSPLPPPTSNSGFLPPGPPRHPSMAQVPQSYINLPPRRSAGQNSAPSFGMGLGTGAMAAGAMIFGENFLSGPSFNAHLDGASLTVSPDTPF